MLDPKWQRDISPQPFFVLYFKIFDLIYYVTNIHLIKICRHFPLPPPLYFSVIEHMRTCMKE